MEGNDSNRRTKRQLEKIRRVADYLVKNPNSSVSEITDSMPFTRSTTSKVLTRHDEFTFIPNLDHSVREPMKTWVLDPDTVRDSSAFDSDEADNILQTENEILEKLSNRGLLEELTLGREAFEFLRENRDILDYDIKDKDLDKYSGGYGLPAKLAAIFLQIWVEHTSRAKNVEIDGDLHLRSKNNQDDILDEMKFMIDTENIFAQVEKQNFLDDER